MIKTILAILLLAATPARALDPIQQRALSVGAVFAVAGFTTHIATNPEEPFRLRSEWTKTDTAMLVLSETGLALDWMTTLDIRHHGHVDIKGRFHPNKETNPVLGSHPSDALINRMMILNIVGHATVAYILPNPYRKVWQGMVIGMEFDSVANNFRVGLTMRLPL